MNIEHLPTQLRYTGVALSFTLSYLLFGGVVGLSIENFLLKGLHHEILPCLYLLFGAFLVIISVLTLKEEAKHSLEEI